MLGWIEVIEAQQKREVLNFLIEKLEARQSLVEDSILDGTATPADVIAIEAEISAARAELLAAQAAEAAGRAMLARWIGDAAQRPLSTNQRSEEHTSELQSLMRISFAVFCLKK